MEAMDKSESKPQVSTEKEAPQLNILSLLMPSTFAIQQVKNITEDSEVRKSSSELGQAVSKFSNDNVRAAGKGVNEIYTAEAKVVGAVAKHGPEYVDGAIDVVTGVAKSIVAPGSGTNDVIKGLAKGAKAVGSAGKDAAQVITDTASNLGDQGKQAAQNAAANIARVEQKVEQAAEALAPKLQQAADDTARYAAPVTHYILKKLTK